MSFWGEVGGFFKDVGKGIWEGTGEIGGAVGGLIGGWISGKRGSQIGGQIGGAVQRIANPQAPYYQAGTPQPQPSYERAGCFIATECYNTVPQKFYDLKNRLPSYLVRSYYFISPRLIPLIRLTHSHSFVRKLLNILVRG